MIGAVWGPQRSVNVIGGAKGAPGAPALTR